MKTAHKRQWVDALRSGKYAQGTSRLVTTDVHGLKSHCCLGVLAQLHDKLPEDTCLTASGGVPRDLSDAKMVLSPSFAKSIGISRDLQTDLASKNDNGYTFNMIADYIEESL